MVILQDWEESLTLTEILHHFGGRLGFPVAPQGEIEQGRIRAHLWPAPKGSFGVTAQPCPWKWALQGQAWRSRRASGSCTRLERSVATVPQLIGQSSSMEIAAT